MEIRCPLSSPALAGSLVGNNNQACKRKGINMLHTTRHWLGLAAGGLLFTALMVSSVQAEPQQNSEPGNPGTSNGASRTSAQQKRTEPGWRNLPPLSRDSWRSQLWSPYNAWSNPYWYPPYNRNYPLPPYQAYPYIPGPVYPYPVPVPTPYPLPYPGIGAAGLGQ
jgi:hypothetical protein